ncbi:hypothetical protein SAMN05444157_3807 [Frankineae bacterium MT45]|nr:hypothetical protein SAMN05444157_3807 [Frankineae bacterium MT45]
MKQGPKTKNKKLAAFTPKIQDHTVANPRDALQATAYNGSTVITLQRNVDEKTLDKHSVTCNFAGLPMSRAAVRSRRAPD